MTFIDALQNSANIATILATILAVLVFSEKTDNTEETKKVLLFPRTIRSWF